MLTSENVMVVMAGLVMATHAQSNANNWWKTPDKVWLMGQGGDSCDEVCEEAGYRCTHENELAMRFAALGKTNMEVFMGEANFNEFCYGRTLPDKGRTTRTTNDVPFTWGDDRGCEFGDHRHDGSGSRSDCATRAHDRRARRVCQCTKPEEDEIEEDIEYEVSEERKKLMNHIDRNVISRGFSQDRWGMCYIGCFKDDRSRDLDKRVGGSHNVDSCRRECSKMNYTYFSVQYGTECRCGNNYATQRKYIRLDDSKCKRSGYPAGQGGAWANSVYKTECSDDCSLFNGIPHRDGKTCCHHTCGKYCGARNCHQAPMGGDACCASQIADHELCWQHEETPCTLSEPQGARLCTDVGLDGECCHAGPGKWSMPSPGCNIPNDSLKSVALSKHCTVDLYQHYNSKGRKWTLKGSETFGSDHFQGNTVSSFEVKCDRRD